MISMFDGIEVITEQVKQGLTEPCFLVSLVNPTNKQVLGNRYYRTNLFSIQYIPQSTTDARSECYEVQDALFEALEYITVSGDLVRGTEMKGEFIDEVLIFLVNYNMFIYRETENDPMEVVSVENQAR